MSSYVKKVHFKLHESYANPLRGKMSKDWKKNCCKRVPYYFYKQWNPTLRPPRYNGHLIITASFLSAGKNVWWGEGSLCRAVTNTSSWRVYVISSRGFVQPGSNFGSIFLLFLIRVAEAHAHSNQGKSPAPPGSYSDSPALWYQINRMGILWVRMCRILITFGPIW